MSWKFTNERPIFLQLTERIELKIIKGDYPPGGKLETVRELALMAGVNPNTMQRALAELENIGVLFSKRGDGRYVTEDSAIITALRDRYVAQKTQDYISSLRELSLSDDAILQAVSDGLRSNSNERKRES